MSVEFGSSCPFVADTRSLAQSIGRCKKQKIRYDMFFSDAAKADLFFRLSAHNKGFRWAREHERGRLGEGVCP